MPEKLRVGNGERLMRAFAFDRMVDRPLVLAAARTSSKLSRLAQNWHYDKDSIDVLIGTYCIEHGHSLLHDDRDFAPIAEHLGLRLA
jgi:predicted nucleic acid-binding protein